MDARTSETDPVAGRYDDEFREVAGLDGLYIGCPPEQRHRRAPLAPISPAVTRWTSPNAG